MIVSPKGHDLARSVPDGAGSWEPAPSKNSARVKQDLILGRERGPASKRGPLIFENRRVGYRGRAIISNPIAGAIGRASCIRLEIYSQLTATLKSDISSSVAWRRRTSLSVITKSGPTCSIIIEETHEAKHPALRRSPVRRYSNVNPAI